ncbi:MAG: hypothetical protein HYZ79_09235, partial [Candidatus Melainabacteria bacterium]|nr:hypothetical protein [Candidatus Melainabacteria bacterium]
MKIFTSPLPVLALAGAALFYTQKSEKPNEPQVVQVQAAQTTDVKTPNFLTYEPLITKEMLQKDLTFLASDAHMGREPGRMHLEGEV